MADHHDDFVHVVPHDTLDDFGDKGRPSQPDGTTTIKSTVDIPIPPGRNMPGSDPESAARSANATSGSLPSWLQDNDAAAGAASSQPYKLPTDVNFQRDHQPVSQQLKDYISTSPSYIREVPRTFQEGTSGNNSTSGSTSGSGGFSSYVTPSTPSINTNTFASQPSSSESRILPPPSKLNDNKQPSYDSEKKTESCPCPMPNLMEFMSKHVPPRVQYVLFYRDPVYSLLVLGGVAGMLWFLLGGYTYSLLWFTAFIMKWTMLTALAVSGGHYAYKRFIQKQANPIHYGERHFKPRIEPIVARIKPFIPSQDWVNEKLGLAVRLAYWAPRKFLDTIYSNNWGAMLKGLVALQVIQSLFCCLSPRGLVWLIFGLVCTVPKIYQMYRGPIDNFIHFVHDKFVAICHALQHQKKKATATAAAVAAPSTTADTSKSPFPATVTTTILTLPAGAAIPAGLLQPQSTTVFKKDQ